MSADKRTVATDALETLGMVIDETQKRDAIHLAVEPIEAGEQLHPGQDVGIRDGKALAAVGVNPLGIVDPFLTAPVQPGQRFWLVVYPRQIHSLRHVWTHPAFPDEPEVAGMAPKLGTAAQAVSEAWLREWCGRVDGVDYDTLIETATEGSTRSAMDRYGDSYGTEIEGEYFMVYGHDAHGEIPNEVWDHVEIVTGKRMTARPHWFSCSC